MKAVNLLPREISRRRTRRRVDLLLAGGIAVTVAVVAAVGAGFVLAHSHARTEQQKLTTARATLARLQAQQQQSAPTAKAPALAPPAVLSQTQWWQAALASAVSTRFAWDHTLTELSHVVPAGVTFSSLTLGGSGAAASTSPAGTVSAGSLSLSGTTSSEAAVAQLLSRLMLLPDLTQVELNSSTVDATGVVTFQVQAQVTA
jgi:Tfp pilus assembly protein PilN